ncbi:MAG TPA: hypothetical protein ENO05_07165 [Bacteroides sp.]|nr:hypothetical protein [Bacteroides sp.]
MHIDRSYITSDSFEKNEIQVIEEMKKTTPQDRLAFIRDHIELKDNLRIPVISVEDLFKNKSSTGRKKDEADLEELRKLLDKDDSKNDTD